VGSAPVGNGPSELAVDTATHTVYVTNGLNDNGPNAGGDTVSVIDTRHCDALDVSRCKGPWPTIKVGHEPSTIAVDAATDTVYVDNNSDDTVSVFNGATCNAMDTSGCDQKPATVPVGSQPMGIFVDDANHTVYVGNPGKGNTVSMIDSATCNASDLATCPKTQPPTVKVGSPAEDVVVDEATQTVYVGTLAAVSVFDANTCNATLQTGCGDIGTLKGDSYSGPNGFGIDPANDTLYTANYDNSISAWDLADCNASDLAGCAKQKPGYVLPFPYSQWDAALWLVVDVPLHSVYVAYQRDDALIVVDTNLCNGSHLARCATLHPPEVPTGAMPESVDLDPQTETLYVANQIDNDVSVIDASACDARVTRGCRQAPTAVPISTPANGFETFHGGILEAPFAVDAAVNTVYVPTSASAVAMINTVTCNGHAPTGCADKPRRVTVGANPSAVAIDALTDTVYVANFGSATKAGPGTVSVIDAGTCNATETGGCAHLGAWVRTGKRSRFEAR
jgi:DNA-binding beta-propeller fold protein YncE